MAVAPVAVDRVAVDPVAVDPVAVDPVAVDPVAVDPVAVDGCGCSLNPRSQLQATWPRALQGRDIRNTRKP